MKSHSRFAFMILATVVAAVGVTLFLARTSRTTQELPSYWEPPRFALIDQEGDTLRSSDLRGRAWVASFIFTNCTGVCPLISTRMARLRDELRERRLLGDAVRLVSFSVDPERDSPEVLKAYAERFGASPPAHWAFLTGTNADSIRAMIQKGFRVTAMPPDSSSGADPLSPAGYQVMHTPRIVLVDPNGMVRALYDSTGPRVVERIVDDVRRILQ